jgi:hypothetical protein
MERGHQPPQAASVNSRGCERCGNAGTTISAGKLYDRKTQITAADLLNGSSDSILRQP